MSGLHGGNGWISTKVIIYTLPHSLNNIIHSFDDLSKINHKSMTHLKDLIMKLHDHSLTYSN